MDTIKSGQMYKHFKTGNTYKIIALAKHSETLEDLVVYEALYDNQVSKIWVRPIGMFTETIERDGKIMKRFELIQE